MRLKSSQSGFALLTVIILSVVFSIVIAGVFHLITSLGATSALYERAEYAESVNHAAGNAAAELIEQIILDKADAVTPMVTDVNWVAQDLLPSSAAQWDDSVESSPDLTIDHGHGYQTRVDVDYVPLSTGFSWLSIKFGSAYQEAAAGNSSVGSLTYRIHVLTTGPGRRKFESEGIYVVAP